MTRQEPHTNHQNVSGSLVMTEQGTISQTNVKSTRVFFDARARAVIAGGFVAVVVLMGTPAIIHTCLKYKQAGWGKDSPTGNDEANILVPPDLKSHSEQLKNNHRQNDMVEITEEGTINGIEICKTPACLIAAAQISKALDRSVDPCNDFYQFACGGWMEDHPFPHNGRVGIYDEVLKLVNERILSILESEAAPGDPLPLHMTRTMYSTCMDVEAMEEIGLTPVLSSLDIQGGWPMSMETWDPSHFDLQSALVNLRDINVHPLVAVWVDKNLHNTTENIIYLNAGTVPLGVTIMSNPSDKVTDAYKSFMIKTATYLRNELGHSVTDDDIAQQVDQVIQFEIDFSKMVIDGSIHATDHAWLTDVTELQEYTDAGIPGMFNWLSFFKQIFSKTEIMITINEPVLSFNGPFFSDLSILLNATDSRTLANTIGWWWFYDMAQETTEYMREIEIEFLQAIGLPPTNRTTHCRQQTQINLGNAVSRDYVDKYFSPVFKVEALQMVADIKVAFDHLMDESTWLSPEDLVVAKDKLDVTEAFVAYPDWILDDNELTLAYGGLVLTDKKQYTNLLHIGKWSDLGNLETLRKKPVHSFAIPPTTVNAYYKADDNAITVTASILQNPYFAHESLAALNYGGIGFFMGHEMTHGFDTIGRLYDKDGNLVQWWSNETIRAFNDKAQCFVDQYNQYYPPELTTIGINISINGLRTLPENIADNGGIREAYKAYQLYVNRHGEEARLPGLEDFSPDQIFYLGFAYTWCVHESAYVVLEELAIDAHSPERFRVFGSLSNDEDFSYVWKCPSGSPMNRGSERCVLW